MEWKKKLQRRICCVYMFTESNSAIDTSLAARNLTLQKTREKIYIYKTLAGFVYKRLRLLRLKVTVSEEPILERSWTERLGVAGSSW